MLHNSSRNLSQSKQLLVSYKTNASVHCWWGWYREIPSYQSDRAWVWASANEYRIPSDGSHRYYFLRRCRRTMPQSTMLYLGTHRHRRQGIISHASVYSMERKSIIGCWWNQHRKFVDARIPTSQQWTKTRAIQRDSTDILGSLLIAIFMENLHQFAPVWVQPLWQAPKDLQLLLVSFSGSVYKIYFFLIIRCDSEKIWNSKAFLHWAGALQQHVSLLDKRLVQTIPPTRGLDGVCVIWTKPPSHQSIRRFVGAWVQDIYVFPTSQSRTKRIHGGLRRIDWWTPCDSG